MSVSFNQGNYGELFYTDTDVVEAIKLISEYTDLLAQGDFYNFYRMILDEIYDSFSSEWPLYLYILYSDELGFTPEYMLKHMHRIPTQYFKYLPSDLHELTIPGNIKAIESLAFYNNLSLHTVTIEEGCERLSEEAFEGCDSLKILYLPESLRIAGRIETFLDSFHHPITIITEKGGSWVKPIEQLRELYPNTFKKINWEFR